MNMVVSSARPTGLRRAFASMFAGGILGKLLGFGREAALAATFGTGSAAAALRAAQTATLIPTHFFSNETLNSGFVPLCARYLRDDPARARTLIWSVFAFVNAIAIAVAALLFLAANLWTGVLVPGFSAADSELTAGMLRAMAIGVPFYVMAALASYIEMASGRYFISSMRASIQNVGLIAGIGAAAITGNPLLLGWGFTAFSIAFALFGLWSLHSAGLLGFPVRIRWSEARTVLGEFTRLAKPLLVLPLAHQGAIAVERIVASLIGTDVVASVDYAKTISETGLALLAVPIGMAGLSQLGRIDTSQAQEKLQRLLPALLVVTVPCSAFLAIHAEPVLRLLFARGAFDDRSVAVTALVLTGLGLGFWAQVSGYVLTKALSARGRNGSVAIAVGAACSAHILINVATFRTLGAFGIGIATSAAGIVLLGMTVRAFSLGHTLRTSLVPLVAGALAYAPIGLTVRGSAPLSLIPSALVCVIFWIAVISVSRPLRTAALSIVRGQAHAPVSRAHHAPTAALGRAP